MREQIIWAHSRAIYELPLEHSIGAAAMPRYETPAPHVQHQADLGEAAHHISVWPTTPSFEPEGLDFEMQFPLSLPNLVTAIRNTDGITPSFASFVVPTFPQVHDLYGSFIAVPPWLEQTEKVALVFDCRAINGTVFSVYHQGPLTRASALQHIDDQEAAGRRFLCVREPCSVAG